MPYELKPCPACWTDSVMLFRDEESSLRWGECDDPDCSMHGPWRETDEEAISAWNALPRAPRLVEYDGTEATLPPVGECVLVSAKAGWRDYDKCRDRGEIMEWRYQGLPLEIGDRWMSWPEGGA